MVFKVVAWSFQGVTHLPDYLSVYRGGIHVVKLLSVFYYMRWGSGYISAKSLEGHQENYFPPPQ